MTNCTPHCRRRSASEWNCSTLRAACMGGGGEDGVALSAGQCPLCLLLCSLLLLQRQPL